MDRRFELQVCDDIQAAIVAAATIPDDCTTPMRSTDLMQLIMKQLSGNSIPSPSDADTIELLGWLELPLDDAEHLLVGGFNEGFVPQAITSDLFLPNRIRQHLGIDDDRRRYARDAYALTVLLESRTTFHLVTSKCDADGNPLKPSRLLFATDEERIVQRWDRILTATGETDFAGLFDVEQNDFGFRVPAVVDPELPFEKITVTQFKTFLECPYRYYLQCRLKLKTVEHHYEELNAAAFGSLVHDVLARFGNSEYRNLDDADQIKEALDRYLDEKTEQVFGTRPLTAVKVQIEQLRERLGYFAETQARLVSEGWEIFYAESDDASQTDQIEIDWTVDEAIVKLVGRIDRIDHHQSEGRFRVLDYKTFDASRKKTPDETHRSGGDWKDLQLPLYRHLAATKGVVGDPELGYFIIGNSQAATDVFCADWDEEVLESADEKAREVISRIQRNDFGEPVVLNSNYDDWKRICLEDIPRR